MALEPAMQAPHVFVFRLLGSFDRATLQVAVNKMVVQHEALRTQILQRGRPNPWQHIVAASDAKSLDVVTVQPPSGLYDVDDTEAGSMPAWIDEAVVCVQQLQIPMNQAPLAAINLYEVTRSATCMLKSMASHPGS